MFASEITLLRFIITYFFPENTAELCFKYSYIFESCLFSSLKSVLTNAWFSFLKKKKSETVHFCSFCLRSYICSAWILHLSGHFLPHFRKLQDGTCILLIKYLFINPSSFKYKLPGANFATLVNIYRWGTSLWRKAFDWELDWSTDSNTHIHVSLADIVCDTFMGKSNAFHYYTKFLPIF